MLSKPTFFKFVAPALATIVLLSTACAGNTGTTESAPAQEPAAPAEAAATEPASEEADTDTAAEPAGEEPAEEATEAESAGEAASEESAAAEAAAPIAMTKLNLNSVTGDELLNTIPGFGDRMVREFMEYRPYISIQQFRREIGKYVDEAQVADYEQYVFVPVDVNESDAETLKQLPGVDDAIAETLMAARPYDSNNAFLAQLTDLTSAEDAAAASGYLVTQ